ncbi:MAG: hypothetical protein ACFFAY_09550 [Promethearchaeota archaeon]
MRNTGRFSLISLLSITLLAMATFVTPVAAAYVTVTEDQYVFQLQPDDNGHSYVYFEHNPTSYVSRHMASFFEDTSVNSYAYDSSGWDTSSYGSPGPLETAWTWGGHTTPTPGPYGESAPLPTFFDVYADSGDSLVANVTAYQRSFSLQVGQDTSFVAEPGYRYYGALGIGAEEFIHLQIGCRSESVTWSVIVYDPDGIRVGGTTESEGDVGLIPFRPAKSGTYVVSITISNSDSGLIVFDLRPESIRPQEIPLEGLVDGNLPGSEWVIRDNNIVYEEKVPVAHTYRFSSSEEGPAKLLYSLNIPDWILPPFEPIQPAMFITCDAYYTYYAEQHQFNSIRTAMADSFGYQSFEGMPYYVTVFGGENYEYSIYNQDLRASELPTNELLYMENLLNPSYEHRIFGLHLEQDSLMKINATTAPAEVWWSYWRVVDGVMQPNFALSYTDDFDSAPVNYLPAGDYVFEAYINPGVAEHFQFTVGPVGDSPTIDVKNGGIAGFRTSGSAFDFYNLTCSFLTQDNVTTMTRIGVMDVDGTSLYASLVSLGNIQSGSSWVAFPANESLWQLNSQSDMDAIVWVSPSWVVNNTAGLGNDYPDYVVRYQVGWDLDPESRFDEVKTLAITTSPGAVNFTLPGPGSNNEEYLLRLSVPAGVWLNVTVTVAEVDNWDPYIWQVFNNRAQVLSGTAVSDTAMGSETDVLTFQFGSICEDIFMRFNVDRVGNPEGFFHISIDPLDTLSYEGVEVPEPGPAPLPDTILYVAIGAGAVVVVVVLVVLYKRKSTSTL